MGVMGTIVGFGAGYALGANRSAAPIKRAEGKVRDAVAQRLPVQLRSIGTPESRQVRDVMTAMPQTVSLETPIADAARMMADEGIGDVIVVEQGTDGSSGSSRTAISRSERLRRAWGRPPRSAMSTVATSSPWSRRRPCVMPSI